ncbi:right-handed parallel beta-helix repeat-containing protein, partial [Candidatus Woesearchaeota archaeon]|nr:right-handed parallel beta-helix repeat-containing protein [Candidatus Woesearchaeota archaeon]
TKLFSNNSIADRLFNNYTELVDGRYLLNASGNDSAGNRAETETRNITIDATNPTIIFVNPTQNNGTITITYIIINASLSDNNSHSINITLWNTTGLTKLFSNNTLSDRLFNNYTGLNDGRYLFNATGNDTAGNIGITQTWNVTIDTQDYTKPLVNTTIPAVNSIYNITNLIEIGVNATDETAISRVFANITYPNGTINQLTLSNKTGFDNKYNTSFTIPELIGLYNITYFANDSSNNINSSTMSNFTVNVGCASLNKDTTMNQDVTSTRTCFTINNSNLTLDCAGYTAIYGTGGRGYGVNNTGGWDNISIKNCKLQKAYTEDSFNYGIYIQNSKNSTINNNTIYTDGVNWNHGIYTDGSINFTVIDNNTIYTNGTGGSNEGIYFYELSSSKINNTISNNTIYTKGASSENIGIEIGNANFTKVLNNIIRTNGTPDSNLNIIRNNSIITYSGDIDTGIYLKINAGAFNLIANNNITIPEYDSRTKGILIYDSVKNTTIANNTIIGIIGTTSGMYGIHVGASTNSIVYGNSINVSGTSIGIYLGTTSEAGSSNDNVIENNNISTNGTGININSGQNNHFINNTIISSGFEILDEATSSLDNLIYNNSYGQINWTLANLTTNITLQIGNTIFIENNLVGLTNDKQRLNLNGTAQIEIRNITYTYTPWLLKDNRRCDNSSACNVTFSNNIVYANISSFSNYSTVEDTPPAINLTSPTNASTQSSDSTPYFTFNVTDELNTTLDCTLWINDTTTKNASRYGTNNTVQNSSAATITANTSLSNNDYLWWINCSDGLNSNSSVQYNLTINIAVPAAQATTAAGTGGASGGGGGCPFGQVLSNGQCQLPAPTEEKVCDCAENEVCVDGTCQTVEEEKKAEPADASEQKEAAQKINEALEQLKEKAALTGQAFFNRLFSSSSKQYYIGLAILVLLSVLLVAPIKVRKVIIKRKLKQKKENLLQNINSLRNKQLDLKKKPTYSLIQQLPKPNQPEYNVLGYGKELLSSRIFEPKKQLKEEKLIENITIKQELIKQKLLKKELLLRNAKLIQEKIKMLKRKDDWKKLLEENKQTAIRASQRGIERGIERGIKPPKHI